MKLKHILLMGGARNAFAKAATTALVLAAGAQPALAQVGSSPQPPGVFKTVDENGVNLVNTRLMVTLASIQVGPDGPGGLSYIWSTDYSNQDEVFGYVWDGFAPVYSVTVGGSSQTFTLTGTLSSGTFASDQGNGSTLVYNNGTGVFTYTSADGTVATFTKQLVSGSPASNYYKITSLTYPAGETLTYYYVYHPDTSGGGSLPVYDVRSVTSSLGYQLRIGYTARPTIPSQYYVSSVVAFDMADETCDPAAASCTLTGTWPSLTYNLSTGDVTDATGKTVRYTVTSSAAQITWPSGKQWNYTGGGNPANLVFSVATMSDGKGTWTYNRPSPYVTATLVFRPNFAVPHQVQFDGAGQISYDTTEQILTHYVYDSNERVTSRTVAPASGSGPTSETQYSYDSRGNLIQQRLISTTPGTPADIIVSASYPSTCSNLKTCNQPDYTIDANGQRIDYTYDASNGGLATITLPADSGGIRPQRRYTYTALSANYRDGTGTVIAGAPAYRPTSVSQCVTTSSCTGTADEMKTDTTYSANDALLPVSVTTASGSGTPAATATATYYPTGDVKTTDGPLAGGADTDRTYYDTQRRPIGTIGADPDGAGALLRRATRTTYDNDGRVSLVEVGTATGQGDSDMSTFVSLEQTATDYDTQGRVLKERRLVSGTTVSVTQYSYTNGGLLECTAVRMNPATYASLPASACTPATPGSFGPDRITQATYNGYYQVTSVTSAVGTALASAEITNAYNSLGQLESITDGESNKTTNEYDGFGRRVKTRFPVATKGANSSSTTDYEQIGYDAAGRITSRRLRDGQAIAYTYDNLNRLTFKNLPGTEPDVSYSYDLLNRMISATTSAQTLTFGYDALGRNTSQGGPIGTVSYQYDPAGRRTRMTWPDSTYMNYDYFVTGEMKTIVEGSTPVTLDTFAYDNLGRRTSVTRSNGTTTTYGYDGVSRLTSIAHDVASTANDVTYGYTYSPADGIVSETRDNNAYAWGGAASVARSYASNGLNQYGTAGPATFTYDARGNLTGDGTNTYTYDSDNHMLSSSGSLAATLDYDPLGRLYQITNSTGSLQMLYDGDTLISEHHPGTGAVSRRYVWGPGRDELMLYYLGATLTTPRSQQADIRGSIVSSASPAGVVNVINSYDEFGIPATGNFGRFQYTGQAWLSEIGMYYYKARMYSPTLGRFMQTDSIGYRDGMNWHAYVKNDPVNKRDPKGREAGGVGNATECCDGPDIVVTARRMENDLYNKFVPSSLWGSSANFGPQGMQQQSGRCDGPLRRPSPSMMNEATNDALGDIGSKSTTSELTSEFSKVNDLPDFSTGGWSKVASIHGSSSYEHTLPGYSGKVVKIYIGDRNFGGANTATITDPTSSFSHFAGVLPYELGMPVNARNAAVYLSAREGC